MPAVDFGSKNISTADVARVRAAMESEGFTGTNAELTAHIQDAVWRWFRNQISSIERRIAEQAAIAGVQEIEEE